MDRATDEQPAGEEARDELFGPAQRWPVRPYAQRGGQWLASVRRRLVLMEYPMATGAGHGPAARTVSGDLVRLEMRERRLMGHVDVLPDAVPEVPRARGLCGLSAMVCRVTASVRSYRSMTLRRGREANVQSVLRGVLGCDGGFPAHGHRQSAVIVGGQIAVGRKAGEPLFGLPSRCRLW